MIKYIPVIHINITVLMTLVCLLATYPVFFDAVFQYRLEVVDYAIQYRQILMIFNWTLIISLLSNIGAKKEGY